MIASSTGSVVAQAPPLAPAAPGAAPTGGEGVVVTHVAPSGHAQ